MRRTVWGLSVVLFVTFISVLTSLSFQTARTVTQGGVAFLPDSQPQAHAGPDQTVRVGSTVLLDGSRSVDAGGSALTFNWSFVSVPEESSATLDNGGAVSPSFLADRPGDYVVQLAVSNGTHTSAAETAVISTVNSRPIAEAGLSRSAMPGTIVMLDGSGSSDLDGDLLRFSWVVASAPSGSGAFLMDSSSVQSSLNVTVPGEYVVQLVVSDGALNSLADTVIITTGNTTPLADAGPDQHAVVGRPVQLDASSSADMNGDKLGFEWSFVSRPTGSAAIVSHSSSVKAAFTPDIPGSYVVQLATHDGQAKSAPDTVVIRTGNGNTRPVADAGLDQVIYLGSVPLDDTAMSAGTIVQLDGSGSTDIDGDLLTYLWSFVSRPSGSAATLSDDNAVRPTFTADMAGTYVVQLIITDGIRISEPETVVLTTGNTVPVASAGADQTVSVGSTVQLDGTASFDALDDPLRSSWSIVSKPAGSTAALINPAALKPMFVADVPGSYVVQLVVNDGSSSSAPDTVLINTDNSRPVAYAGVNRTAAPGATVKLDGTSSSDPDSDPMAFQWALISRPSGSSAGISTGSLIPDVSGTYVVQLIVSDGKLQSAPDTFTVVAADSVAIGCGDLKTGNITVAGQIDEYTFSGVAGDRITLTLTSSLSFGVPATGTVLAPTAAVVATINATEHKQLTLPETGTYTVQVRANNLSSVGTYHFGLECLMPTSPVDAVLGCGSLLSRTLASPSQVDQFTFNGQAGDRITLTLTSSLSFGVPATATMFSPTAVVVSTISATDHKQLTLTETGTYIIQVRANNLSSVGPYHFGVECLLPTSPVDAVLGCGSLVSRTLDNPSQVDQFTFNGQAGDRITLTLTSSLSFGVPATATMFSPTVAVVTTISATEHEQLTLTETGTYIIQVRANNLSSVGPYHFGVECLLPTSPVDAVLGCGSLQSRTLASPSQVDQFTFNGQAGDRITLTLTSSLSFGVPATATMFSPTAAVVSTISATDHKQLTLTETGTYIIQVRANNLSSVGPYHFGVECLLPTSPVDAVLGCGSLVSRTLDNPSQVDQFTFNGQAGDRITLTLTSSLSFGVPATATMFSPTAAVVTTISATEHKQLTLTEAGTYIIQVRANNLSSVGPYHFGVECLLPTNPIDAVLGCGSLQSRTLASPSQVDQFTFNGQAGDRITLTLTSSLSFGVPATATMFSPTAAVVSTISATDHKQLTLTETGTYIIQVRANNLSSVGPYHFGVECLLPTSPVDAVLGCGSLVSRTLDNPSQVDQFTFNGQAGDRITLTLTSSLSFGVPATATMFSPTAAVVSTISATDHKQLTLTETGTYIIQVRANNLSSVGPYHFGVECLLPTNPIDAVLGCGSLQSRTLASPSQVDQFTFNGQAGDRITLTLTSSLSFGVPATATMFSPTAVVVTTISATEHKQLTLTEAGTYIIQVRANNLSSVGPYHFGVECLLPTNPIDATLPAGASVVNRTITSPSQVDQITFCGQVGDRVRLALTSALSFGVPATATVFSPSAAAIVTFNANGEQQPLLPETGRYIVQIRANNLSSTGPYTLTGDIPSNCADIAISKTHTGNFKQGQIGASYTINVNNVGSGPSSGNVTVTDTLPAALTATGIAGSGWTCVLATVSCSRAEALGAGQSYPSIVLTLNVAANAPTSVTNTAIVAGGGDLNPGNNTANDLTLIDRAPDLSITKRHADNFRRGQTARYTITVNNVSTVPTAGTVTVIDTLPAGLSAISLTGTGWTCTLQTISCTRSDALAGGASYPVITLRVSIAPNAPKNVNNIAQVSGGGDVTPGNNTATDPTVIPGDQ